MTSFIIGVAIITLAFIAWALIEMTSADQHPLASKNARTRFVTRVTVFLGSLCMGWVAWVYWGRSPVDILVGLAIITGCLVCLVEGPST